jgi:hypothetical protein
VHQTTITTAFSVLFGLYTLGILDDTLNVVVDKEVVNVETASVTFLGAWKMHTRTTHHLTNSKMTHIKLYIRIRRYQNTRSFEQ